MNTGDRIKQRRLELGMTLEEVADIVGVTRSTVRKWETGMIENMRRDKIALLARALNVSPLFVMGNDLEQKDYVPETIAAHFAGEEFTQDDLEDISDFIEYVKAKKKKRKED